MKEKLVKMLAEFKRVPESEIKASLETRKAVKVIVDNAVAVKPE